jgi:hypothetical protein
MKLPDEAPTGVPRDGAAAASEEPVSGVFDALARCAEELLASANGLIEVETDRVRHSVRQTIVRVALATAAAICAGLWLGAASLATLRGLCGGFAALWGGSEWLGDLCGGALALTLGAGVVALHLKLAARRECNRLEAKYEQIRNKAGTSDDGGAAARQGAGTGDRAHPRSAAERG